MNQCALRVLGEPKKEDMIIPREAELTHFRNKYSIRMTELQTIHVEKKHISVLSILILSRRIFHKL